MRKRISFLIATILAVGLSLAQTGVDIRQLQVRTEGQILLIGEGIFNVKAVNLGEMFEVDDSVSPSVLNATAPGGNLKWFEQHYIDLVVTTADFVLTNKTGVESSLMVFRNGLLMMKNVDYTMGAMTVQFVSVQVPQIGDNVVVRYQVTN